MNDVEYKGWCDRIDERLRFWVPRLGLHHWQRNVSYLRVEADDTERGHPEGYGTPMRITVDWRYMNLHLEVFTAFLQSSQPSASHLDRMLVHELLHCIAAELRVGVRSRDEEHHLDHEEHVVSWLTTAICSLYEELEAWDTKRGRKIARLEREIKRLTAAVVAA